MNPIEAYIRHAASARGIDPDIAVSVALSEGGLNDPVRQSDYVKNGRREPSYGPFQLYMGGGLGNRALASGIDPRDPGQWQRGVDFALDEAAQKGWGQWYGAAKVGIGNRAGINGARAIGVAPAFSPGALDFVKNNPQPGGFGPGVPTPDMPAPAFVPPDGPKGQESYAPPSPGLPAMAAAATSPEQSLLGKMMAGFASGMGGGAGQAQQPAGPAVIQDGGFGATMAAQQGAEQAKQLAFSMSPDIEKMLALTPRPFAKKPAGPMVVG